ncbi:hypothetical protein ACVWYH_005910 [Bradyrhizobium sp. GM24.11]
MKILHLGLNYSTLLPVELGRKKIFGPNEGVLHELSSIRCRSRR